MRPDQRAALRRRFDFCCGYCGVSETEVGAELTVDHFQPRSRGGAEQEANWVYACFTCNNLKSDVWAPDTARRILHPVNDDVSSHIAEEPDGTLTGLTETGQFHIAQLQLSRPPLIALRLSRLREEERRQALQEALRAQETLRQRVAELERAVAEAQRRLSSSLQEDA
jgi:hypothetical protein